MLFLNRILLLLQHTRSVNGLSPLDFRFVFIRMPDSGSCVYSRL